MAKNRKKDAPKCWFCGANPRNQAHKDCLQQQSTGKCIVHHKYNAKGE